MIGKGIESLIPKKGEEPRHGKEAIFWIEVDKIKPNPLQPRKEMDEESLNSLAESIKRHGLLQPIIVSKREIKGENGYISEYQIIAGERRYRASLLIGLKQLPTIIKEPTEQERLEVALVENVQRKNLNPMEKAETFERFRKEFNLLEKEIAEIAGTSREGVANTLRLLSLSEDIKNAVKEGKITEGHAKAILLLKDTKRHKKLLDEIILKGYSVRKAEQRARDLNQPKEIRKSVVKIDTKPLEEEFRKVFSVKDAKIKNEKGKVKVITTFNSKEDFYKWIKKIKKQFD